MKKILFVINNLETGGVQKSLLNLLKEINKFYDITLLSFFGNAAFERELPKNVKLIVIKSPFKHLGMSKKDINNIFLYFSRIVWVVLTKIFGRSFVIRLMGVFQKKLKGYDYAISYLHEGPQQNLYGGCNEFVLKKVQAEKKFTWLHCDFNLCGANNETSKKIYERFDKIIACSEGCAKSFVNCLPHLSSKVISIRNCNDYEYIKMQAQGGYKYDINFFNIVTVARLSEEKGIERAIEAVNLCVKKGYKVKYHIIGSGDRKAYLENMVKSLKIEDTVFFYGNKNNPYKYMVNADLFLLTSYHEAAPMVFDEAICLGVPIFTTKTTSTDEMVEKNGLGIVCENNQKSIDCSLAEILLNPTKLQSIRENIKNQVLNNEEVIIKLQTLLDR